MPKLRREIPSGTRGGKNDGSSPAGPILSSSCGRKVEVKSGNARAFAGRCAVPANLMAWAPCRGECGAAQGEPGGEDVGEVRTVEDVRERAWESKSEPASESDRDEEVAEALDERRSWVFENAGGCAGPAPQA